MTQWQQIIQAYFDFYVCIHHVLQGWYGTMWTVTKILLEGIVDINQVGDFQTLSWAPLSTFEVVLQGVSNIQHTWNLSRTQNLENTIGLLSCKAWFILLLNASCESEFHCVSLKGKWNAYQLLHHQNSLCIRIHRKFEPGFRCPHY